VVLAQTIFQYTIAGIVFPDFFAEEQVDLRKHYWAHTRWFFGLTILMLLASVSKDYVLSGHLTNPLNLAFHLIIIALALVALLTRNEWYHKFLAAAAVPIFCAYIVLLFAHLR